MYIPSLSRPIVFSRRPDVGRLSSLAIEAPEDTNSHPELYAVQKSSRSWFPDSRLVSPHDAFGHELARSVFNDQNPTEKEGNAEDRERDIR